MSLLPRIEDEGRDFLAEALAIVEKRSSLRAQREHLEAMYGVIRTLPKEQYEVILETHPYPKQ
jgi:hypothetical protein